MGISTTGVAFIVVSLVAAFFVLRAIALALSPGASEAQKLANLLVSGIKLYRDEELETALAERKLSADLREEIERMRAMFNDKIPVEERTHQSRRSPR